MKSSLFKSMLCASILVFAVGCGKENKSGGGNKYSNGYGYNNQNLINQSENTKILNWYNGTVEGNSVHPNFGTVQALKKVSVYNTQQTCENKKFLGIPYTYCTFDGTPDVTSTPVFVNIQYPDNRAIKNKGNAALNEVFNTSGKTVLEVKYIDQYRTQITHLNNSTGEIIIYGINRSINSGFNPEFKRTTSQTQRIDTLISF